MSTVFTTNKNLIEPAQGSFNNAWGTAINAGGWSAIDNAFGGNTVINVTGVTAGTYALTIAQYQPPIIVFDGTITGNLIYVLPFGVGGVWSVSNFTTGAFTVTFAVSGGTGFAVPQGFRISALSDGFGTDAADSALAAAAQANAEAFATAADAVVLASAESFASSAAATAQSNAQIFAQNANNINTGTVGAAFLPLAGNLDGITIAVDPGTTPSGSPGDIFYFY
jgi:hypothetical protein